MNTKETIDAILAETGKAVLGKDDVLRRILTAILAGGHILIDDIPGVGKTTMAVAFTRTLGLDYKRMQFTPDVLPSDITGFSMYDKASGSFRYVAGSAMTNFFLADEINRASPKTQSLCIFTQPSDDLASNAPLGNLMCLASSLVYAVYLVFSNRLLKGVGDMTMLKYTFLGAAVMAVIVNTIYGFDAPILKMSLFSTPMLVLLFVLVFPTTISYLLLPLGLKYLKTTLVAIYGYLILIVATVTSFVLGQDRFSWTQLAAIVLICASVYLVEVAESNKQITSKLK